LVIFAIFAAWRENVTFYEDIKKAIFDTDLTDSQKRSAAIDKRAGSFHDRGALRASSPFATSWFVSRITRIQIKKTTRYTSAFTPESS
jgi:hypothetical protein